MSGDKNIFAKQNFFHFVVDAKTENKIFNQKIFPKQFFVEALLGFEIVRVYKAAYIRTLRIKPRAVGCEVRMLPSVLCCTTAIAAPTG